MIHIKAGDFENEVALAIEIEKYLRDRRLNVSFQMPPSHLSKEHYTVVSGITVNEMSRESVEVDITLE